MAGEVCWRTAFGVHWAVQTENLEAWPDFPRFLPVDWGHFKAWQSKVIPLSLGVANVGAVWAEGQQKLEIHLQKIHLVRTGNKIISARHPALPFSKVLSLLRSFFLWLILKRSFGKDLIYLWKTTPSPPYSGITNELNVCTHMHIPQPCSKLRSCELCISTFMFFHLWIYGCKETRLGQEYPKFLLPSISAVYQLLAFSVWSGSNWNHVMFCFDEMDNMKR